MIALAGCKFSLALNEFMVLTPDSTAFDPLSASAKQGLHMYIARWPRFYRVHCKSPRRKSLFCYFRLLLG